MSNAWETHGSGILFHHAKKGRALVVWREVAIRGYAVRRSVDLYLNWRRTLGEQDSCSDFN